MKELILFRGLPGAGKSTLANCLGVLTYSADDYFTHKDGSYTFIADNLSEAHRDCLLKTERAMAEWQHPIIGVANTFTQEWELEPYFILAEKYGYQVHSLVVENRHQGQSIHSVPSETIATMRSRFHIQL